MRLTIFKISTFIILLLFGNILMETQFNDSSKLNEMKSYSTITNHEWASNINSSHKISRRRFNSVIVNNVSSLFNRQRVTRSTIVLDKISNNEDVIVETKSGRIRGFKQKFENSSVNTFLGVPYAEKPIGHRRFRLPEPIERWDGVFMATTASKTCYYTIDTMFPQFPGAEMWNPPNELDEDCLSLNIWTPVGDHNGTVLVWIYGGGFFSGSPSLELYDGRVLAAKERLIVVNINYRLGPFGFLFFGQTSQVPGNMGLMDQQLALKWIYENIGYFGGNPKSITLHGESAGGASVSAQLFAPGSQNFFNRLIIKSGTIINNWATKSQKTILNISLNLARRVNCTSGPISQSPTQKNLFLLQEESKEINIENILNCMSNISAVIIQREANIISDLLTVPMTFAFVPIDEDYNFFQGNLFEKINRRDFKKDVTVIMGAVKDEGTYWLPYYLNKYGFSFNHTISAEDNANQALITEADYIRAFDAFLPYFGNSQLVRHALLHAYSSSIPLRINSRRTAEELTYDGPTTKMANKKDRWRNGIARFLGDYFFTCALVDFADMLSENIYGAVYFYYFTRRSSANPWPKWMGVMHGYEIEYIFGLPFRHIQQYATAEREIEQHFSQRIMDLWRTFATTGVADEHWPSYNRMTRISVILDERISNQTLHLTYSDVHGQFCRLIHEAQMLAIKK